MMSIKRLIDEHGPRCVVLDPLSAMVKAGGQITALGMAQRLIHLAKSKGITLLCTSLLDVRGSLVSEATEIRVSTIADTWINLSYVPQGGERNRALTIVKSRGTEHSHQIRELILSYKGITLTDVYSSGGEVLMGTLRWEKEVADRKAEEKKQAQAERKRIELELEKAEIDAKIRLLERELEANRAELDRISAYEKERRIVEDQKLADMKRLRDAD